MDTNTDRWWEKLDPIPYTDFTNGSYILHFDRPVPYEKAHLYGDGRHYIGASVDIPRRVQTHKLGLGSKMTKVAVAEGIPFTLVAVFPTTVGDRPYYVESLLTTIGASSYCPICNEEEFLKIKAERDATPKRIKTGKNTSDYWHNLNPRAKENIRRAQQRKKKG